MMQSLYCTELNHSIVLLDESLGHADGIVEVWRGGVWSNVSVAAPFVWRCLIGSAMAPFPHPAHRTGLADFPDLALGKDFTPVRA
jgi:transposase